MKEQKETPLLSQVAEGNADKKDLVDTLTARGEIERGIQATKL